MLKEATMGMEVGPVPDFPEENLLSRILDSYREAMKLEVRLFPIRDRGGIASIEGKGHPFCYAIRNCAQGRKSCLKDINRAIQVSINTGEACIFQCHADVIEFAAAIRDGARGSAAFVCGPILLRHPDDFIVEQIVRSLKALPLDRPLLTRLISKIPVYSERRVQAAADLLFLIANHFTGNDFPAQHQQLEISREQSLLAENLFAGKISRLGAERLPAPPTFPRGDLYKEEQLIDLIKIGNRKKARAFLDEILGSALFRSREHLGILKARALEIVFVIARAAVEAGANLEEILGFQYQYVRNLSQDDSEETLYHFLIKAFDQLFECIYQSRNIRHTTVFTKAKQYIWKNYNQEMSLKKLAEAVGMSPYYLSHLFRKEMGTSFLDYLTSVRISVAKNLLKQTNMSVMDICLEVGYQDPSHFAKVFAKRVGAQPTEFRKK